MKQNKTTDQQIFNRLTRLYLIALLAVAFISLIGQFLIQLILKELIDDSHVVNIAGRQRMYSQKITKRSLLIYDASLQAINTNQQRNMLAIDLEKWTKNHNDLKSGKIFNNKPFYANSNLKINQLYQDIEPKFILIQKNVASIIKNKSKEELKNSLDIILKNEGDFLNLMNKIVEEYDILAKQKVTRTRLFEIFLFSLLLFVLVLEAFFIFRPIAKQIRYSVKQLTNSQNQLQKANEILIETNKKLEETKKELVKTTNEKYELKVAEEKIRTSALVSGQEQERKRLSRELHDGIGQMLTGIRLQVEHINDINFEKDKHKVAFEELKQLIGETIETTRTVAYNLAPSVLSDFGLNAALKLFIEQCTNSSGIKILLNYSINDRLLENMEIAFYRIVQEAAHNSVKYAKATLLEISIVKKDKNVILTIEDNGIGFDISKQNKSLKNIEKNGLKNMKTRAEILNGKFEILTKSGQGTKIIVSIPL